MARRGRKPFNPPEALIARLGNQSDTSLAAEFGVSNATIAKLRKERGIPYFSPRKARGAAVKQVDDDSAKVTIISKVMVFPDGSEEYQLLNSFKGVRTYWRGALDPRLTLTGEPPFFDDWAEADAYLKEAPGTYRPVQIPMTIARPLFSVGWAEPTIPRPIPSTLVDKLRRGQESGAHLSASEVRILTGAQ